MKKPILLACIATLSLGTLMPAMADEHDWYQRYDRNHDGHWNYQEYRKAHYDYARQHRDEQRLSDRELREHFQRMSQSHPGWVQREEVQTFHKWEH